MLTSSSLRSWSFSAWWDPDTLSFLLILSFQICALCVLQWSRPVEVVFSLHLTLSTLQVFSEFSEFALVSCALLMFFGQLKCWLFPTGNGMSAECASCSAWLYLLLCLQWVKGCVGPPRCEFHFWNITCDQRLIYLFLHDEDFILLSWFVRMRKLDTPRFGAGWEICLGWNHSSVIQDFGNPRYFWISSTSHCSHHLVSAYCVPSTLNAWSHIILIETPVKYPIWQVQKYTQEELPFLLQRLI